MRWRTLSTTETDAWHDVLRRFDRSDVYFLPEYHQAYERNGDGAARAYVAEEGEQVLFYPFLVRPIKAESAEGWCDVETVYGYSGPLATTREPGFLAQAWSAFAAWCRENRVVAEFIRFNPLLANHGLAGDTCRVGSERSTVVMDLGRSEAELWDAYPPAQRQNVRKAMKGGLICEELAGGEGWREFRRLYHATMERNGARDYYDFGEPYFDHLAGALAGSVKLFGVRDRNRVVAAAVFLVHGDVLHYHLGGSDAACREARPNNLLFHTAALWGRARGFRRLHLGGGRTAEPQDTLYRFKASLSHLRLPFYMGQRVHEPAMYERLCSAWLRRKGLDRRPSYFLLYRMEDGR